MQVAAMVNYPQSSREGTTTVPRFWTYAQIADDLKQRIDAGEYPPGTPIPTQRQLAEDYGVHQTTAAKAVSALRWLGVVEGAQGRRVFVREDYQPERTE